MGYIYKNIAAGIAFTEIVPLNTISKFETITITNTGADATINIYLYATEDAVVSSPLIPDSPNPQLETIIDTVEKTFYILHDTLMTADVTLVLDPSDFAFDNSLYSLRFDTTTSADIIINATASDYVTPSNLESPIPPVAKGQNYTSYATGGVLTDEENNAINNQEAYNNRGEY